MLQCAHDQLEMCTYSTGVCMLPVIVCMLHCMHATTTTTVPGMFCCLAKLGQQNVLLYNMKNWGGPHQNVFLAKEYFGKDWSQEKIFIGKDGNQENRSRNVTHVSRSVAMHRFISSLHLVVMYVSSLTYSPCSVRWQKTRS